MSDKYLVISSDCHASPPAERYREKLDPQHREAYDEHQAAMQKMMEQMGLARGAASGKITSPARRSAAASPAAGRVILSWCWPALVPTTGG